MTMTLTPKQQEELIKTLKTRFDSNINRHVGITWEDVQSRLEANINKMWSLNEMEKTGGEPDIVGYDKKTGAYIFYDCSAESPTGRRSTCYDKEGLESRKKHKPDNRTANNKNHSIPIVSKYTYLKRYKKTYND